MPNRLRPLLLLPLLVLTFATALVLAPAYTAAAASGVSAASPDFSVTVSPLAQTRKRGTGAPYFVTLTSLNGFNQPVTLSLTGNIPSTGVVTIDNPSGFGPLHDGEVAIQIMKRTSLIGTFAMTIHANGGGIEHDVNISLTIV